MNRTAYARLQQQALEWQVSLWSGEVSAAEQRAFEDWLASSALHQQAWNEVSDMQKKLSALPAQAASLLKEQPQASRRRLLQLLGVTAIAGGTLPVMRYSDAWQDWTADHHTHTGEQQRLVLADGSTLTLNTATAVDIAFTPQERRLVLHRGEMYIATSADAVRPFLVQTRHGTAQALGTRFNVRLKSDETRVSVHQGAVMLKPLHQPDAYHLQSGMQAGFSSRQVSMPSPTGSESAWLEGRLVAERMRLGDFLDELGRYRPGMIRYDAQVADMVLSGVFPLPDTDRILQSLLQALPLRMSYFSRYWVAVHAL